MNEVVGWAEVATKSDLQHVQRGVVGEIRALELRLESRFERGFRQILVTVMTLMITGFIATVVANLAS